MSKILTLAATGLAGIALVAGVGIAAAEDTTPTTVDRRLDTPTMVAGAMEMGSMQMGPMEMGPMDEEHRPMHDRMDAGMEQHCDDTPTAMTGHARGRRGADATGPGRSRVTPQEHAQHHPERS